MDRQNVRDKNQMSLLSFLQSNTRYIHINTETVKNIKENKKQRQITSQFLAKDFSVRYFLREQDNHLFARRRRLEGNWRNFLSRQEGLVC